MFRSSRKRWIVDYSLSVIEPESVITTCGKWRQQEGGVNQSRVLCRGKIVRPLTAEIQPHLSLTMFTETIKCKMERWIKSLFVVCWAGSWRSLRRATASRCSHGPETASLLLLRPLFQALGCALCSSAQFAANVEKHFSFQLLAVSSLIAWRKLPNKCNLFCWPGGSLPVFAAGLSVWQCTYTLWKCALGGVKLNWGIFQTIP